MRALMEYGWKTELIKYVTNRYVRSYRATQRSTKAKRNKKTVGAWLNAAGCG